MSERIDIGHGVTIALVFWPPEAGADRVGKLAGVDYWHGCTKALPVSDTSRSMGRASCGPW